MSNTEEESETSSDDDEIPPLSKQEIKKVKRKRKLEGVKSRIEVDTEEEGEEEGGAQPVKKQVKMSNGQPPARFLFNPDTLEWDSA